MAEYQQFTAAFKRLNISHYAITTDNQEMAQKAADAAKVNFPLIYGVDGPALSQAWGSYYEERRNILHATAFVLGPDRRILHANYSTGPVGRLTAKDAQSVILFYRARAEKAGK